MGNLTAAIFLHRLLPPIPANTSDWCCPCDRVNGGEAPLSSSSLCSVPRAALLRVAADRCSSLASLVRFYTVRWKVRRGGRTY